MKKLLLCIRSLWSSNRFHGNKRKELNMP